MMKFGETLFHAVLFCGWAYIAAGQVYWGEAVQEYDKSVMEFQETIDSWSQSLAETDK